MKEVLGTKYIVRRWNGIVNAWLQIGRPYAKIESAHDAARKLMMDAMTDANDESVKLQIVRREVQEFVLEEIWR